MFIAVLLGVLFICIAMLIREGLWSNALTFINAVMAGLIATSYFEPLAAWAEGLGAFMGSLTYGLDFLSFWGIFFLAFAILRTVTDLLSKVRVRFKLPVEYVGGGVFALLTGWVLVCITAMSFHIAPLSQDFMSGALQPDKDHSVLLGTSPDQQWLSFSRHVTGNGSFSKSSSDGFDPDEKLVLRYGERRYRFQQTPEFRVR